MAEDEITGEYPLNVTITVYNGIKSFHPNDPNLAKSYFVINIYGSKKYIRKQTAMWLLSYDKPTASTDRLRRFMTSHKRQMFVLDLIVYANRYKTTS